MSETLNLNKNDINKQIINDSNFKSILKSYKSDITSAFKLEFSNEYKNGLCSIVYGITIDDDLISLLVPIFSSEKTSTWNLSYLKTIKESLPKEYSSMEDHELVNIIKCPIYYLDKFTGEIIFLSLINLSDWIEYGSKGRNGYSVYFWNDKLPNKYSVTKNILLSDIFEMQLPYFNKKQLQKLCLDHATKFHSKFANVAERSAKTMIKNIANGLYAEIEVFLHLKNEGYDVKMAWSDGDDLGIDIQLYIQKTWINIDVKSTKTEDLKIAKNRKETDFYAVCTWNKSNVILEGFLFKYNFWKSDIMKTEAPEKKNDMYHKSLKDLNKYLVSIDDIYTPYNKYKTLKMKRSSRLFNDQ